MSLSTKQLTDALKIRKMIDELDAKRETLIEKLQHTLSGAPAVGKAFTRAKGPKKSRATKAKRTRRSRQGSKKQMVRDVLAAATKPLTADQIIDGLKAKGHSGKAKNPKRTLSVQLYTDKAIARVGRGLFALKEAVTPKTSPKKTKPAAKKKS